MEARTRKEMRKPSAEMFTSITTLSSLLSNKKKKEKRNVVLEKMKLNESQVINPINLITSPSLGGGGPKYQQSSQQNV